MKLKNVIKIVFLITMSALINACQNSLAPEDQNDNVVYFNSFESESDLSGWSGVTKECLVKTDCPNGGNYSLRIGGGCVQPAASFEFLPFRKGNYKLSFWAKMGQFSQSAVIVLRAFENLSDINKISVQVSGEDWKYYESEKSLNISTFQILQLEILVGGIIFADVHIDELKIEKIN